MYVYVYIYIFSQLTQHIALIQSTRVRYVSFHVFVRIQEQNLSE